MEDEGIRQLVDEKVQKKEINVARSADLRYEGQSWELNTPIEATQKLNNAAIETIIYNFHQLHQRVYSYSEPTEVLEFVNLRVSVTGKNPTLLLPRETRSPVPIEDGCKETRNVYFEDIGWQTIPVYEREELSAGYEIVGPCIIEEAICTILIPVGFKGIVDEYRNIIIALGNNG
jgi:N-methylhydantoinase A